MGKLIWGSVLFFFGLLGINSVGFLAVLCAMVGLVLIIWGSVVLTYRQQAAAAARHADPRRYPATPRRTFEAQLTIKRITQSEFEAGLFGNSWEIWCKNGYNSVKPYLGTLYLPADTAQDTLWGDFKTKTIPTLAFAAESYTHYRSQSDLHLSLEYVRTALNLERPLRWEKGFEIAEPLDNVFTEEYEKEGKTYHRLLQVERNSVVIFSDLNPAIVKSTSSAIGQPLSSAFSESTANIPFYKQNDKINALSNKVEGAVKAVFAIKTQMGHGSGFIINPLGYAITNYHVVAEIDSFDAIFIDGKIIKGNVIKKLPDLDLALCKLTGEDYPFLAFADVNTLILGQEVYAIGTPLSLELQQSISKGVLSGIRNFEHLTLIQTDAPLNPGNSGGPLIDSSGKAIGLVSLRLKQFGVEGIGFAISIEEVVKNYQLVEGPIK